MHPVHQALSALMSLDESTWESFQSVLKPLALDKGALVLSPGQTCKHIYFVQTGLLRSFCVVEGEERNLAFGLENTFITDLKSLRTEQPSNLAIQALEPTLVHKMAKADLLKLYERSHSLAELGRQLLEHLLTEQQEHAAEYKLYSAKERYALLMQRQPLLLQRVSLSHLASYLGIQRETLSRIRRHR